MYKTLGIVIGGMFAGAVVMEVLHKKCPNTVAKIYSTADDLTAGIADGFKEGYQSVTKSDKKAEAEAA